MELNLIGLCCSQPHLLVYSKLRKMKDNETVKVITDDSTVVERDIIPLAKTFGCNFSITKEKDIYIIFIKKNIIH